MSIFDIDTPIIEEYFETHNWHKIGWGSPHARKEKNTVCFEKTLKGNTIKGAIIKYDFVYFPKDWEGWFVNGKNMRGWIIADEMIDEGNTYGVKIESVSDLEFFIQCIINDDEKIKKRAIIKYF